MATLSLVLPSIIVIVLVAKALDRFSQNPYVKSSFALIRPAVTGLIVTAVWGIFKTALLTGADGQFRIPYELLAICLIFFLLMNIKKFKSLHPALWIFAGALLGIVFKL